MSCWELLVILGSSLHFYPFFFVESSLSSARKTYSPLVNMAYMAR